MSPEELHRRIVLARTPTVATEDALTVAKLHDLIIQYIKAADAWDNASLRDRAAAADLGVADRALRIAVFGPEAVR